MTRLHLPLVEVKSAIQNKHWLFILQGIASDMSTCSCLKITLRHAQRLILMMASSSAAPTDFVLWLSLDWAKRL